MTGPARLGATLPEPSTAPAVDVAISIVCHDDRRALIHCLRSLKRACDGVRWTVTVVQNVAQPHDPPLGPQFAWVHTVNNVVPAGFAANHNQVLGPIVNESGARYVLVLNDDTELAPGCLAALVRYADEHPDAGAVGPRLSWPDGTVQESLYSFPTIATSLRSALRPTRLSCRPLAGGDGWLVGACLLLRCNSLRQIGLFDDRFFLFFEDMDLARRLHQAGWRSAMCTAASVTHSAHDTVARPDMRLVMEHQMIRSQYLFFERYNGTRAALVLASLSRAAFLARATLAFTEGLATRDPSYRDLARRLTSFARYRPTTPLPHEAVAAGAGSLDRGEHES